MPKLFEVVDGSEKRGFYFNCPGCKRGHALISRPFDSDGGTGWQFNGDAESPTFRPGIMSRHISSDSGEISVCHLFVTDGWLYFWNDCTHWLSGLSVAMEEISWEE